MKAHNEPVYVVMKYCDGGPDKPLAYFWDLGEAREWMSQQEGDYYHYDVETVWPAGEEQHGCRW